MATVNVGTVWNLQDCLVMSAHIKCVPRNFYPGALRSGQFRDLPITSLRGNTKMLPFSHMPIKATQFFQDHGHSRHLCRSGCNWRSGVTGRSPEVKWRHNPFFANKSRQDGDRDAQMVPNDLARQAASKDMHIDPLRSWPDLVLMSNFEIDLSRSRGTCFEPARQAKHDGVIFIFVSLISEKLSMKNHLREKR